MKKILLSIGMNVFLAIQLNASQPIRWGVVGGLNISKPTKTDYSEMYGFHIGGKAEFDLSTNDNRFYINPAVLFSLKGGKPPTYYQPGGIKTESNVYNYYLNIPVYVGYKHSLNEKVALFGSVGPYMGLGLFGKFKNKVGDTTHSINIYSGNGYLDKFDWGFGGQTGVEISKKIQISIGYELGLKNVAKTGDYKNRNFTVSCGYMF